MDVISPAWLALGCTLIVNFITIGYITGTLSSRVNHMEGELLKLINEMKDMRTLVPELASVKTQLEHINSTLARIEGMWMYYSRKDKDTHA